MSQDGPNLFELRHRVRSEIATAADAYAREKAGHWSYGVYSPNDFPTMYEHGYLSGFLAAQSEAALADLLKQRDELLAALREAKAVLDGEWPDWADDFQPLFNQIEAAIAKAEGRKP